MASLKEVKIRINSVNSTRKITSAMKMVASSKLHKAQQAIENMRPYERMLNGILSRMLSAGQSVGSPYSVERKVNRIAVVVMASNSSLCGGFNANIIKAFSKMLQSYPELKPEDIDLYPIGRKAAEAVNKMGYIAKDDLNEYADKPQYAAMSKLSGQLMKQFEKGEIDKVEMIYNHFKNTGCQIITNETFLPFSFDNASDENESVSNSDYIIEPTASELLTSLLPKVLNLKLFTALLDSNASEHAARTTAMQIATDNADELLRQLTLTYNKTRQQAITMELLDIVGGSMK